MQSAPTAHSAEAPASGEAAFFDTWRAVVKFTYRVFVTTVDFGANYFVIGEPATAAELSTSQGARMDYPPSALDLPLHPDFRFLAQCRRGFSRQANPPAP